jgi:type I restriction-modification system DNA methylase subunit
MSSKPVFETKLNILLSEILNQMGIISKSEQLGKGRKDILVNYQGLQIVLEGSYNRLDAERDARKRIEQTPIDLAIAIYYPELIPQELSEHEIKEKLKKTQFEVKVIVPVDISQTLLKFLFNRKIIPQPVEEWIKVDINSLGNLIRESAQFIIREEELEEIEKKIDSYIQEFVSALSSHPNSKVIAKNLYEVLFKLYGFSIGNPEEIKEIIFAQSGLALLLSTIYYETIRYTERLEDLVSLSKAKTPKKALEEAFKKILEINYEAIFKVAIEILSALPHIGRLFDELVELGSEIASKRSLLRRDLAGKVYHKVVGEWSLRKGLATYYTQIPSAYLLLYLAKPKLGRVCDFACGSGTLLTAAYSAMRANYFFEQMRNGKEEEPEKINEDFHIKFIENCYGFDVLKYATQISALNVAFHNPEIKVRKFHIHALPLGVREDGTISLGSLDFIKPAPSLKDIFSRKTKTVGLDKEEEKLIITLNPFDLVVMNPPFTRAGGRWKEEAGKKGGLFGFMSDEEIRIKVMKEYDAVRKSISEILLNKAKNLLNNSKLKFLLTQREFSSYQNIGQAGEGLIFLYLAHKFVKENGKIGFVLPKNVLSATSWFLARCLLASDYHLEYIVVSYDPEGYNFSYSTNLSECLLVARKVSSHSPEEETKFVILLKKPKTSIEAIMLANSINQTEEDGYVFSGNSKALIIKVKKNELLDNVDNFGKFIFLPNMVLLELSKHLINNEIKVGKEHIKIPLKPLNEIIESIGIDSKQFGILFKNTNTKVPGSLEAFKGGDEKSRSMIYVKPNMYVVPKGKSAEKIYEEKKGRLILPSAIWLTTAHVTTMLSEKPILSTPFYVVKLKEETEEKIKALCLWYNTTFGFTSILLNRQEVRGVWIQLPMAQWKLTLALDVNKLTKKQLEELAKLFDEIKNEKLRRIPEQYNVKDGVDPIRLKIDKRFLEILGAEIDEKELLNLYEQLYQTLKYWSGELGDNE